MRARKLLKEILGRPRQTGRQEEEEQSDSNIEREDRLKLIKHSQIEVRDLEKQLNFVESLLK